MQEQAKVNNITFRPQAGKQTAFLSSAADIAIYGGGAGGGKTWSLIMECLRFTDNPKFNAVIFRRTYQQVKMQGGIWDDTENVFPYFGAKSNLTDLTWTFPNSKTGKINGAVIGFAHLQREKDKTNYQGAQIPLICFDELTHFTETQFFYLLSRNRAGSCEGIKPYIRATCNPDPDSWVKKFILWWLDENGEYADESKSGKLRWFVRDGNQIVWSDTKEELKERYPKQNPLSVTFIPSSLKDNKILCENDPDYEAKLLSLPYVDRMQLLNGNWKIKPSAGLYFKEQYFSIAHRINPEKIVKVCRYWDRASTKPKKENKDPDYTAGVLMGRTDQKSYIILDVKHFRGSPSEVENIIINTAKQDHAEWKGKYIIGLEVEPGASGQFEADYYTKVLAGYSLKLNKVSQNKITRASPFSSQAEGGNISILYGPWNSEYIKELEAFPDGSHDDMVDGSSGAFSLLALALNAFAGWK